MIWSRIAETAARRSPGAALPGLMMAGQKEGDTMTEEEKKQAEAIARRLDALPEDMRRLIVTYMQGVTDAEALQNERDLGK